MIPIAIDRDRHKVDVERQRKVLKRLKEIGVPIGVLINQLKEASAPAVYEYVALQRMRSLSERRHEIAELERLLIGRKGPLVRDAGVERLLAKRYESLFAEFGPVGMGWWRGPLRRRRYPATDRGIESYVQSVQRNVMPGLRRLAYRAIKARAEQDVRLLPSEAFGFTADLLQVLFPTFGARTTSELVRKSVRRGKGVARSSHSRR